jgi:hypothetical protein
VEELRETDKFGKSEPGRPDATIPSRRFSRDEMVGERPEKIRREELICEGGEDLVPKV